MDLYNNKIRTSTYYIIRNRIFSLKDKKKEAGRELSIIQVHNNYKISMYKKKE